MRIHSSLAKENKRTRVLLQKCSYDLNDGDLKGAETPGTYTVCKGTRSEMLDVREEEQNLKRR